MSETNENIAPQSRQMLQTFVSNVCKILRLCGAISLLVFILSLSNLATVSSMEGHFGVLYRKDPPP